MVIAGYGIRIGGVSGGAAVGTGSALGALVGRTTTLPTAAKAANARFATTDFTFVEGPGAANTGIQVDGESEVKVARWVSPGGGPALVDGVPFGNIPINVDGFWVIARQGTNVATATETDRIKVLRDGAVARDARPLYFRRIPGAAGFTGDASIDVVVDQASVDEGGAYVGELRIGFEGNGEALPAHCYIEVYLSLAGGSEGPRGPRGLKGDKGDDGIGGDGGSSTFAGLTDTPAAAGSEGQTVQWKSGALENTDVPDDVQAKITADIAAHAGDDDAHHDPVTSLPWTSITGRPTIPEVNRRLEDFEDNALEGDGWATVPGAIAQHLGDKPNLSQAEAFDYTDTWIVGPHFANQWGCFRVAKGTPDAEIDTIWSLLVGAVRTLGEGWERIAGTSSTAFDYYTYQVADKPAGDSLSVQKFDPINVPAKNVSGLAAVATSGDYGDLLNRPALGHSEILIDNADVGGVSPTNFGQAVVGNWIDIPSSSITETEHTAYNLADVTYSITNANPTSGSWDPDSAANAPVTSDTEERVNETNSVLIRAAGAAGVELRSKPYYSGGANVGNPVWKLREVGASYPKTLQRTVDWDPNSRHTATGSAAIGAIGTLYSRTLGAAGSGGDSPGTAAGGIETLVDYTWTQNFPAITMRQFKELPAAAAFSRALVAGDNNKVLNIQIRYSGRQGTLSPDQAPVWSNVSQWRVSDWRNATATADDTAANLNNYGDGIYEGCTFAVWDNDSGAQESWSRGIMAKGTNGRPGIIVNRTGLVWAIRAWLS